MVHHALKESALRPLETIGDKSKRAVSFLQINDRLGIYRSRVVRTVPVYKIPAPKRFAIVDTKTMRLPSKESSDPPFPPQPGQGRDKVSQKLHEQ